MNDTERPTYNDIHSMLADSVETSVRATRHNADPDTERDIADFPLVDHDYIAAIPPRVLPEVRGAARRLRELTKDGGRIHADAAVGPESLKLLESFPRRWRLPKLDPAELAARIPR
jgi:hypothetical protein